MMRPIERRIPRTGSGMWCAARSDGHRLHAGVDLLAPVGTDVRAPEGGTIAVTAIAATPTQPRRSSPAGWSGYGPKCVLLRGDSGTYHLLAHLGEVLCVVGQRVAEGDVLGKVGVTSSPHCHWEVRSRPQPIGRAAVVEICGSPEAWLAGGWEAYDGRCPAHPVDDARTPRACRPSWRGPAPDPFPRPVPRPIRVTGPKVRTRRRRVGEEVSDGY